MIYWIQNLYNKAFVEGIVQKDWRREVTVTLYKGKGDKGNCNYNLRMFIECCREFRSDRGCVNQIFALKEMCGNMREKKNKLYLILMNLQKAYDSFSTETLCKIFFICYLDGRLLNGIKSMHVNGEACVRINIDKSE